MPDISASLPQSIFTFGVYGPGRHARL